MLPYSRGKCWLIDSMPYVVSIDLCSHTHSLRTLARLANRPPMLGSYQKGTLLSPPQSTVMRASHPTSSRCRVFRRCRSWSVAARWLSRELRALTARRKLLTELRKKSPLDIFVTVGVFLDSWQSSVVIDEAITLLCGTLCSKIELCCYAPVDCDKCSSAGRRPMCGSGSAISD